MGKGGPACEFSFSGVPGWLKHLRSSSQLCRSGDSDQCFSTSGTHSIGGTQGDVWGHASWCWNIADFYPFRLYCDLKFFYPDVWQMDYYYSTGKPTSPLFPEWLSLEELGCSPFYAVSQMIHIVSKGRGSQVPQSALASSIRNRILTSHEPSEVWITSSSSIFQRGKP